ncbi:MAG: molecular chaperone TorD, partial [Firmicutes bacterium]|nr:molecular chaperone TorD [Bacillota bacterium]
MRNWYARYGLVAEKKGQEPDDHVGLELEFVAHLAGLALEA